MAACKTVPLQCWTPSEAQVYPGGVLLAELEEWDPPVPMSAVRTVLDSLPTTGNQKVGRSRRASYRRYGSARSA